MDPAQPSRPRGRRLRPLATAVVILILAILATAVWITTREIQIQRTAYSGILADKLEATRRDFRLLLQPFGRNLETIAAWHRADLLPLADPARLAALLGPLVDPRPQIGVACVVPDSGAATLIVRAATGWRTVTGDSAAACREAPWFARAAADTARLQWSDYVPLPGDGRPGLMATVRSGDVVLGLGLPERDLDTFTANAPITENGILIRRFADGTVAWLTPRHGNRLTITDAADLMTSTLPEHAVIGGALRAWGETGRAYGQTFSFAQGGTRWWAVFYPREEGTDPGELGLIAPAGDLERRLATVTGRVTWLLVAVVMLAMAAVVMLAFAYRNRWRRVAGRRLDVPADEAGLAALVAGGESERLEFKSTMRWNLRADKPGKEIELAWLKSVVAYLNTDGGILLFGVSDDGGVLGVEADGFRNDDTYRLHFENLIKQHVGLEFAGRIRGGFRDLAGGRIFLVAVERGDEPAFLRHGEDEEFYVRVGPSSRRLPASRVLDYSRERRR